MNVSQFRVYFSVIIDLLILYWYLFKDQMWTGYVFHEVLKENYNVFFNLNDRDLLDKWIKNSTYLYGSNSCRIPVEPWPIWPSPPSVGFLWRSWPRWRSCWQLSSWWDPSYLARRVIHSNVRGVADASSQIKTLWKAAFIMEIWHQQHQDLNQWEQSLVGARPMRVDQSVPGRPMSFHQDSLQYRNM